MDNAEIQKRMDDFDVRLRKLEIDQSETKIYVKQIFDKLEDLKLSSITKDDLFKFLDQQNKTNSTNLASWQKWTLVIIGGTLFVVVGYFFGH